MNFLKSVKTGMMNVCDLGISPDSFNPRVLYALKRKFNSESKTVYHSHDFISMVYVLAGACTYKINNALYTVKKGDLVICNPGVFHGKILNPWEEISEFHLGLNNISIEGLPRDHMISEDSCPVISLSKYEQDFLKCCNDMLLEQEKGEPGRELMLKSLAMKLIVLFLKAIYTGEISFENNLFNFESYDKTTIVNTVLSFINENYMKEISLDKISRNMYLSPVYISKIFKEEIGESPINYLIKVRLSRAVEMLKEGNLSIKAVAKSIGYDDAYYFSKLFKKYYGRSPSKYKA